MITQQDFQNVISSSEFFDRGVIYFIETKDGEYIKDYCVNDVAETYNDYLDKLGLAVQNKHTIKVQGMEFYNSLIYNHCKKLSNVWNKPVDCHAYFGYKDCGSFAMHSDPCEVCIYICEGIKTIITDVNENAHILNEGEHLYIKEGVKHKAMNTTNCLSLSFGTFDYDKDRVGDIGFKL